VEKENTTLHYLHNSCVHSQTSICPPFVERAAITIVLLPVKDKYQVS